MGVLLNPFLVTAPGGGGGSPTITVSPGSLDVSSGAQSYLLSWSNLTADITVALTGTNPTRFEMSQTGSGSGYAGLGGSLTVDHTAGSSITIWVRFHTPGPAGAATATVTNDSTGATQQTVAITRS
jgi:hypothetical protein